MVITMNTFAVEVTPENDKHIHPKKLYSAGYDLVKKLIAENLVEKTKYSILLYPPDNKNRTYPCVKIEIITPKDTKLLEGSLKVLLNGELGKGTIAQWRFGERDNLGGTESKCKATGIRENIVGNRHPFDLSNDEWAMKIRDYVMNKQVDIQRTLKGSWRGYSSDTNEYFEEFRHLILNPLGLDREDEIKKILQSLV